MKEAVRKCHECQIVTKQHNIDPMKPEILPQGSFQKVAIYFNGQFYDGYYALVFADFYSRWPEPYFVKSASYNVVENTFLDILQHMVHHSKSSQTTDPHLMKKNSVTSARSMVLNTGN